MDSRDFAPEIVNGLPRYSFMDLRRFLPEKFKSVDLPVCLELSGDDMQSFFEVENRINQARKDFLEDVIVTLALDSMDSAYGLSMVSRLCVGFREPYPEELMMDTEIFEDSVFAQDNTGYDLKKRISIIGNTRLIPVKRVRKIEAFAQAFSGKPPEEISDICDNIDFNMDDYLDAQMNEEDIVFVPQPYEIFFAKNGIIRYRMFLETQDYSQESLEKLFGVNIIKRKNGFGVMGRFFEGVFNPYLMDIPRRKQQQEL